MLLIYSEENVSSKLAQMIWEYGIGSPNNIYTSWVGKSSMHVNAPNSPTSCWNFKVYDFLVSLCDVVVYSFNTQIPSFHPSEEKCLFVIDEVKNNHEG